MVENDKNEEFEQKILVCLQEGTLTFEDFKTFFEDRENVVDLHGEFGQTVLINAAKSENKEIVQYLVEHGADVNAKDRYGQTVLMNAADLGNKEIVQYLVEHGADVNAKDEDGQTVLMDAAKSENKEIFEYLVEHGADVHVKDNKGMGVEKYYSKEWNREYRKMQRDAYDGDFWKDIQKHTSMTIIEDNVFGYTTQGGYISVGKYKKVYDVSPLDVFKKKQRLDKKGSEDLELKENWHLESMGHPFERMMIFVHEGNHRMHAILDGMCDGNFTAEQNVKINYCTEAVAHTSMCLAAALQYQKMKEAGIKVYQYVDNKGKVQEMPLEDLLEQYSSELKEYVTKSGFDPTNKKDVEAVTEIGLQYWKEREGFYSQRAGQFDNSSRPSGTGLGVSKEEFEALINRMCDGVVIGDGVELDLRKFADKFNGMSDAEALFHVSRASGKKITNEEAERIIKEREKETIKNELSEQTGKAVMSAPSDKAKQMRFDMRVDEKNLGAKNVVERQDVVKQTKKEVRTLDLAIVNANAGRD